MKHYTAVAEDFQDLRNQAQSRYVYIISELVVNVTYPALHAVSFMCIFKCFWSVESTSKKKEGDRSTS